jgi:flagellar protein FliS
MTDQKPLNLQKAANARKYFVNQVKTASREQLLLMLFDGAIRFSTQAKEKIESNDVEGSHNLLIRSQRIMAELMSALDNSIGEQIYNNLISLYSFVYMRLVRANMNQDTVMIDEALKILAILRETWGDAVEKAKQEDNPEYAAFESARQAESKATGS